MKSFKKIKLTPIFLGPSTTINDKRTSPYFCNMKKNPRIPAIEYLSLLQKALDSNIIDTTRLTEKYGDVCIKDELDKINESRGTNAVLLASFIAKLRHPTWDTRLHSKNNGGLYCLRGISGKVNAKLYSLELLRAATDYACLTPALKGVPSPFDRTFKASIEPATSLPALLNILELINTRENPELLNDMLVYVLSVLKDDKKKNESVKGTAVISSVEVSLKDVSNVLDRLYALGAGSSKLPVIAVFTLLYKIQPYQWPSLSISPLKEHTEADKDRSYGDVEAYDKDSMPKIAIEVKHLIRIDENISLTFQRKTEATDIPLKFILTTAKETSRFTPNDIRIDTVNGFITNYLQATLFYEKNICSIFLKELRKQIINYHNLKFDIKQKANNILTSLLV